LGQSTAGRSAQRGDSNTGLDQWDLIEKTASEKPSKAEKQQRAAADATTWSWADDYAQEAKQLKTQRIAREVQQQGQQGTTPAKEEPSTTPFPPRRSERDDRHGRVDRHGRGDRVERSDKPKKPQYRRKEADEDDDWDDDFYEEKRRRKHERAERERQRLAALGESGLIPIFLPEYISVTNLAIALRQKVDIFVHQLEELGFEDVSKDNILTGETAALVAQEYGFEPTVDAGEEEDLKPAPAPADPSTLPLRPPVVTIMGHVDHGKTTLLDSLRKSSIVSQEHGGITQHIGAFSVSLSGGTQITFLDTPGHAAFLSMRQRGASVTDMVILVVAADDSVKPQTLEALKHARAAKVPIIVAINKVDKHEANVDRVKADLGKHGVEIEDYGGDVQVVCVSGKTGQGMADLEENVLLLSEMLDIRADTGGMAEGWVLESTIKPIGRVATILVKRGTLRAGDFVVAGRVHAKIRSLHNEAGIEVEEATPGTAVEVLGWKEPPVAGDQVLQAPDEGRAKAAVRYRQELKDRGEVIGQMAQQEQERREREIEREREKAVEAAANPRNRRLQKYYGNQALADEAAADAADETPVETTQYLTYLVKGDVHGSVEAVTAALLEQGNNEIRAKVLVSAPGKITESDIEHAAVSGSTIINFNNTVPGNMKRLANDAGVKIMDHNVIYHLVEEVRGNLADALPPLVIKKVVGEAEVLQVFPINVKGRRFKNIAGCKIGNGSVKKGGKARVIRGGEEVFEGEFLFFFLSFPVTLLHFALDICACTHAPWLVWLLTGCYPSRHHRDAQERQEGRRGDEEGE
jgi:translation initiation factor IF-2